ncbi:hypothetical protein ACHAQA_004574 [Verticillium albo-atrum]
MVSAIQCNPFAAVKSQNSSARNPFAEAVAAAAAASVSRKVGPARKTNSSGCCEDAMDVDSRTTNSERRSHKIACRLHRERIRAGLIRNGELATHTFTTTNITSTPLSYSYEMDFDITTPPTYAVEMEIDTATPVKFSTDMELDSDCEFVQGEEEKDRKSRQALSTQSTDKNNNKRRRGRGKGRGKRNDAKKTADEQNQQTRECRSSRKRAPRCNNPNRGKELFPNRVSA